MTRSALPAASIIFDDPKAVLVDMDGVLVLGSEAAPGAAEFLDRFGAKVCLVTNESAYTPEVLSDRLSNLSLHIAPDRLIMAGPVAIDELQKEYPGGQVLIRGAPGLHALARNAGIRTSPPGERAEVVLLGRDPGFDMPALEEIVRAIEDGAELWVTNPDLRHPIEDGRYTYQTGALLQAVLACVGSISHRVIGKPQPTLFDTALARIGALPEEAVMIGDNPDTDGAGARAAGVPFVLVGAALGASVANLEELLGLIDRHSD